MDADGQDRQSMTPVLVVGAGPCGLATACELRRWGVPVRVLEAEPAPRSGSRAILLWPPALEILRSAGVLAEAERRGMSARAMSYHLPGGRVLRVVLGQTNEPLMLPQAETEALLELALERLGGRVERSVQVTDVTVGGDLVTVKAQGPNGPELIETEWLIGADGVRSRVREQLGIEFTGTQFPVTFLVAEGRVDGDVDRAELSYYFGRAGALLVAPLPDGKVRIGTPVPPDTALTPETVQGLLDEFCAGRLRVFDLTMITTFTSHERVAATLRTGRCFLVGDAAHTHSAAGGQGLNLGIQDARNLAWKLAGVIDGRFDPAILATYEKERRRVAEQTVRTTHWLARLLVAGPVEARVRNAVWWVLQTTGVLRRWYGPLLAGWRTRYPDVLFGVESAPRPGGRAAVRARLLPPSGARTPSWVPDPGANDTARLRLLTFGREDGELARRGQAVAERWPALVSHDHLTGRRTGLLLLRPDGYVAASGTRLADLDHLEGLLAALAIPGPPGTA